MSTAPMPAPICFDIRTSVPQLCAGAVLLVAAAAAVLGAQAAGSLRIPALAGLCIAGWRGLSQLLHGRSAAALSRLEWLGGDRWVLWRGDGRCAGGRLDRRSRRIGQAMVLVFRRGAFGRFDRPWALVFPNMVSDPEAVRRLRVRLTLDGRRLRGLPVP